MVVSSCFTRRFARDSLNKRVVNYFDIDDHQRCSSAIERGTVALMIHSPSSVDVVSVPPRVSKRSRMFSNPAPDVGSVVARLSIMVLVESN